MGNEKSAGIPPDPALVEFYKSRGMSEAKAVHTAVLNGNRPLARLMGNARPILERLEAGERVKEIADSYGIAQRTLYTFLLEHAPMEWAKASAAGALERLEAAQAVVEAAEDQVGVSKGATLIRAEQWKLERLAPRLYGGKDQGGGMQITVNIDRGCGGVVTVEGGGGGSDSADDSGYGTPVLVENGETDRG